MATHIRTVFALVVAFVVVFICACEPVKQAHEQPGPIGCGMRDPRETSPGMLSVAQQTTYKQQGSPDELQNNSHGGKSWLYYRKSGSVFGEEQTLETFTFDAQGLLVDKKTDVVYKVGK
jgi:hypothetical protein